MVMGGANAGRQPGQVAFWLQAHKELSCSDQAPVSSCVCEKSKIETENMQS